MKQWPFKVVADERDKPVFQLQAPKTDQDGDEEMKEEEQAVQKFAPEEVSASVLGKVMRDAQRRLGKPVSKCVLTVPANFTDVQKDATREACDIAGLECVRLVTEPVAASVAYVHKMAIDEEDGESIIVYDFGGGTLDVTLVHCETD